MILVDIGAWLALLDRGDLYHKACSEFFRTNREPLITTYPVLVECVHLMFRQVGVARTLVWVETLARAGVEVFVMRTDHLTRLSELMRQYADLPMDLADASLVLLAEENQEGRIVSTDQRDFHTYRWKSQYPFRNLLLEQG